MNIVLTGPMGSGKTTIGRELAARTGRKFLDTDELVERKAGMTISEIFESGGEDAFRALEKGVIRELATKSRAIIAVGGGAVLDPENMRRLRMGGIIVNLSASAGTLLGRLEGSDSRPLLEPARFNEHLESRARYYSNMDFQIDTGAKNVEEAVRGISRIMSLRFVRVCASISGERASEEVSRAAESGATMVELRLDLIPKDTDAARLVRESALPVIATDRRDKGRLREAIAAGCEFVDIEADSPDLDEIIQLARGSGCRVIVSKHFDNGLPEDFILPEGGDLLKVAAHVNGRQDLKRLLDLCFSGRNRIIVGMGELGKPFRVLAPLLGSYLTYCHVGEATADGQMDLEAMLETYRGMGLR